MEIRFLNQSDVAAFWQLRLRALLEHPAAFGSSYAESLAKTDEVRQAHFLSRIALPENFIVGGFQHSALVGTVGLFREDSAKQRHRANIWGMYVAPEQRGQGLARAILTKLIEQARTLTGLEQLLLGVSLSQPIARQLYLQHGFRVYGTDPHALKIGAHYYDEDLMVLDLLDTASTKL